MLQDIQQFLPYFLSADGAVLGIGIAVRAENRSDDGLWARRGFADLVDAHERHLEEGLSSLATWQTSNGFDTREKDERYVSAYMFPGVCATGTHRQTRLLDNELQSEALVDDSNGRVALLRSEWVLDGKGSHFSTDSCPSCKTSFRRLNEFQWTNQQRTHHQVGAKYETVLDRDFKGTIITR